MASPAPSLRISPGFRLALAGKGLLLLGLAVLFGVLAFEAWQRWHWPLLARVSGVGLLGIAAVSVGFAAGLGFADALLGQARQATGAQPLKSRRSGYSLRLPSGRFVEYVLYNPWPRLDAAQTYTVTFGRYSHVLVAPPVPEPAPPPGA